MSTRSGLERMLQASSVAIIGASDSPGMGRNVLTALDEFGFSGQVYPVNPKYEQVGGRRCYKSIADLPPGIDAAAIAIATDRVLPAIADCAERGIQSFVVIAGGFGEGAGDGSDLLQELRRTAIEHDLTICGPNCIGFANLHDRTALWGGSTIGSMRPGTISLVAQSGSPLIALGTDLRSFGCRFLVNTGNEADVDVAEMIDFFARDPGTRVIACYVEQVRRPGQFMAALRRARQAGKPVVAIKGGRSSAGRDAAAAHTASLAGSTEVYDAVFRDSGVIVVRAFDEWLNAIALLEIYPDLKANRLAVVTGSGGCMVMAADTADATGVPLAALAPRTRKQLRAILPSFVDIRNPLDLSYVGLNSVEITERTLEALATNPSTDILCAYLPIPNIDVAAAVVRVAANVQKPLVVSLANAAQPVSNEFLETLRLGKIPLLFGTRPTFEAIASVRRPNRRAAPSTPKTSSAPREATALLDRIANNGGGSESEAKQLLAIYGIPTPDGQVCHSAAAAGRTASALGFPVAVKIAGRGILHKAEVGGVALGIQTVAEAKRAYRQLVSSVKSQRPESEIDGVLVERQVSRGSEAFVGFRSDPEFGPVLLFGSGGANVEAERDVVVRLLPVQANAAREMIGETRLAGHADNDALVDLVCAVATMASTLSGRIDPLEIHPVIVRPDGVVAVDALMVLPAKHAGPTPPI